MARLVIGLIFGIVLGSALTFYFFVGVPKAVIAPGMPIQAPDANGLPAGTAQIVLRQQFFNEVLNTIFQEMNEPTFPLGSNPTEGCDGLITVIRQGSGVETGVNFADQKISVPLAFRGSYSSPFGCYQFTGWAQANFVMRFDSQNQAVFGQINVETVNLDGVNPVAGALLTPIVQSTLNARVNPIRVLNGRQLAINLPVAAARGNLQASVTDVRAEVKDNALNLYVIYDFSGGPLSVSPDATP